MGCSSCRKIKAAASPAGAELRAQKRAASRPAVIRQLRGSAAPESPTRQSARPFNPLRFYVYDAENNLVDEHSTLASAQSQQRTLGPGHRIESRR